MRLIHTSDWHLGQTLHGQDRDYEHAQFLVWLLDQLVAHQADALLIAGDVFDTVNPPLKAQERLYDFIVRAHERLPQLDIVMIAGNHDSGGRIELPAPLMRRLNAHAVGRISWVAEGQLDHERLRVPLHDANGQVAAWCLTLPFLRPAEVTGFNTGDDYMLGIRHVHQHLIVAAEAARQPGQALIAMSHAHMAGGAVSEESERSIVIGNAEALPASLFPEAIAYVALGHLHKPQQVAGQARIRYSGSPLPLSFAEVNYPHQVLLAEFEGDRLENVESLPVPRAVQMIRIGRAPLAEVITALEALPQVGLFSENLPWLEVRVQLDEPLPDLRARIEAALAGKAARLVRIASEYAGRRGDADAEVLLGLDQITPQELFTRAWEEQFGNPPDEQALDDFASLLQTVEFGEGDGR
ncbi:MULTISPECIES: exonuclease SbcCD subunit D C-terminal domain-containing protein [Pseudomonadaceae]|uniref:exonuclease SbcCD subunit D C-terminal domain-containing protein n=1 Tax=Pseudomonadaceae TaxID=135621 RepID=UPI0015E38A86|nr:MULTISPECIES: exonuclease SbcCD subunit D C-terminal domain-containing protein [Pseudomonadaceae]MBA1280188.1 exonuclease subunit SbcD [Stutzerimonas stutzeri]MBC8651360.1 exonuclease subunit SbcD [Pseudomonas sp. MT4]QXY91885.1 exonuclease subunit SbcD [Pseudomonas sp. MTM4]